MKTAMLQCIFITMTISDLMAGPSIIPVSEFPLHGRNARLYCPVDFFRDCPVMKQGPFISGDGKTVVFNTDDGFQINAKHFSGRIIFCAIGEEIPGAAVAFHRKTVLDTMATPFVKGGYCAYNCAASCISFPFDLIGALAGGRGRRDIEAPEIYTKFVAFDDGREMKVDSFDLISVTTRDHLIAGGITFQIGKKKYLWFDGRFFGPYEHFLGMYLSPGGRRLIFAYTEGEKNYVVIGGKKLGPYRAVMSVIINDEGDYGIHYFDGKDERIIINGRDSGPLDGPRLMITGNTSEYTRAYYCDWSESKSEKVKVYYKDENITSEASKGNDAGRYHFMDLYRRPGDGGYRIGYHYMRNGNRFVKIGEKNFGPYDSITRAVWNISGTKALILCGKEGSHYVHRGRRKLGPFNFVKELFFTVRDEPAFIYYSAGSEKTGRSEQRGSEKQMAWVWHKGKTLGPYEKFYLKISDDRRLFCNLSRDSSGYRVMVNGKMFGPYRYVSSIRESSPETFFFEYQTEDKTFSARFDGPLDEKVSCMGHVQPCFYCRPATGAIAYFYEGDPDYCLYLNGARHRICSRMSWPDHPVFSPDLSVYGISYVTKKEKARYCWVNGNTAGPFPADSRLVLGGGKRPYIIHQKGDRLRVDGIRI